MHKNTFWSLVAVTGVALMIFSGIAAFAIASSAGIQVQDAMNQVGPIAAIGLIISILGTWKTTNS